ncbi:hypothetical protein ACTXT7_000435 [Hymenolepis weldensis]
MYEPGDRETARGLPVSPLCDRQTTMVPQSQIGFINFIVTPTFQLLYELLIKMHKDVKKEFKDEADSNIQFSGMLLLMLLFEKSSPYLFVRGLYLVMTV